MTVREAFEKAYGPLPEGSHITTVELDWDDYPGQANSGLEFYVSGLEKHGFESGQRVAVLILPLEETLSIRPRLASG